MPLGSSRPALPPELQKPQLRVWCVTPEMLPCRTGAGRSPVQGQEDPDSMPSVTAQVHRQGSPWPVPGEQDNRRTHTRPPTSLGQEDTSTEGKSPHMHPWLQLLPAPRGALLPSLGSEPPPGEPTQPCLSLYPTDPLPHPSPSPPSRRGWSHGGGRSVPGSSWYHCPQLCPRHHPQGWG